MRLAKALLLGEAQPDEINRIIERARGVVSRDADAIEEYLVMKVALNTALASRLTGHDERIEIANRNAQLLVLMRELLSEPQSQTEFNA